jgi:hypothetical protein
MVVATRTSRTTYGEIEVAANVGQLVPHVVADVGEVGARSVPGASVRPEVDIARGAPTERVKRVDVEPVVAAYDALRKHRAEQLVLQGDKVASRGNLAAAADAYEQAAELYPAIALTSTDGFARTAFTGLVRKRLDDAADALNAVIGAGDKLLPEVQRGLLHAMERHAPREVKDYVARVLNGAARTGLNAAARLKIAKYRGALTTMRDIKLGATAEAATRTIDLSECTVYVDDRLSVGYEGLLRDLMDDPEAWRRRPDIRIELFGSIGELPAVLHEKTNNVFARPMVKRAGATAGLAALVSLRDGDTKTTTNPQR